MVDNRICYDGGGDSILRCPNSICPKFGTGHTVGNPDVTTDPIGEVSEMGPRAGESLEAGGVKFSSDGSGNR